MINKLGQQVSAGVPFSQALARYPKLVSSEYCQVLSVSEKSGDLPRGLRLVASYMEKELNTSSNVKRMLSYPAFLGVLSILVTIVIVVVGVPALLKFFNALHVELPLTTRILISVADFLMVYKFHLILGLAALGIIVPSLWKAPAVKKAWDKVSLKLPVIGSIVISRNICRFCRTGSMLVEAGLTLPQSLNAIIGIIDNNVVRQAFTAIRQEIIKGKGLSRQMINAGIFPRLLTDVISIGEKTGTLQSSFTTMADYYEKRLDIKVRRLLSMIEPASIIVAGMVIGFIGVAILQPLYSIYQNLQF
jgi:type IV pilus assembly protein PilC